MPKSRHRRVLYCPGCGLSCHAGPDRLARHMRNSCSQRKVKAKDSNKKVREETNESNGSGN